MIETITSSDYRKMAIDSSPLSDGIVQLPVTPARLAAMLSGHRGATVLGTFANGRVATIEDVARVALIAGCRPDHMPVLIAAFSILLSPNFPLALFTQSRGSFYPYVIVNGPIREKIELNCRMSVFGPGFRANATIGRALRLGLVHLAGAPSGEEDPSALGTPYRYTCVIGEDEDNSPWPPFQTTLGVDLGLSTVTVLAALHPGHVTQQCSVQPEELLRSYADELTVASSFQALDVEIPTEGFRPKAVIAIGDDHRGFFQAAGWSRERMQRFLHEVTTRRAGTLRAAGFSSDPRVAGASDDDLIHAYSDPSDFIILAAGSGGGRVMVTPAIYGDTRVIEDQPEPGQFPAASASPNTLDEFAAVIDRYLDGGLTDGWPVLPPDTEGVAPLIAATGRNPADIVGGAPWRPQPVTVQDIAINALMAGLGSEQMPLFLSMMELMFAPETDLGIGATACSTHGYVCWFVVQGPIAAELGLKSGNALFGPGHAATMALGRATRLAMMNLAGLKPNLADRACLGQAAKYGVVFTESDAGPWGQAELGWTLRTGQSGITMLWGQHARITVNHDALSAETLLRGVAENIATIQTFDSLSARSPGATEMAAGTEAMVSIVLNRSLAVVLSAGHQDVLRKAGWSRRKVQEFLSERAGRTVEEIRKMGYGVSPFIRHDQAASDFIRPYPPERIFLIAAGGRGGATMTWPVLFGHHRTFPDGPIR